MFFRNKGTTLRGNRLGPIACEALERRTLLSAGDLDTSFNFDGVAVFPTVAGQPLTANDVAVQGDGKVVVVGTSNSNFAVLGRYNTNGSPDTSFGSNGNGLVYLETVNGAKPFQTITANGVAIQPDGAIVVVGSAIVPDIYAGDTAFFIARLLATGQRDTSFGVGDGSAVLQSFNGYFANTASANDVALQSDGKIVVGGTAYTRDLSPLNDDMAIARYNADGTPDSSFTERLIGFGAEDVGRAVTIDYSGTPETNPNYGKILLVGHSSGSSAVNFAVVRLTTTGGFDNSFDGDGRLTRSFTGSHNYSSARGIVVQPSGKYVVAGRVGIGSAYNFGAFRLNTNGSFDSSFGISGGVAEIDFGSSDEAAEEVILSQTGEVILGGSSGGKMAFALLTDAGKLDTAFSGDGKQTTPTTSTTGAGLALSPGGTFVAAGGNNFTAARLHDRRASVYMLAIDSVGYEAGSDPGAFQIYRQEAFPLPTRVYYSVGGAADPERFGPFSYFDYTGLTIYSIFWYYDIPAYQNTASSMVITPVDDTYVEPNELARMTLAPDTAYDINSGAYNGTVLIFDNDHQIEGHVYNDKDGDGYRHVALDGGIAGWTVYLDLNNNSAVDSGEPSTVTDVDGGYAFSGLAAGTYTVRHIAQSGYRRTQPVSTNYHTVTLSAGTVADARDFGYTQLAKITGQVFRDADGDAVKDLNDATIEGIVVYLDANNDSVWNNQEVNTTTNASGYFSLNAPAGTTYLRVNVPSTYVQTLPQNKAAYTLVLSNAQSAGGNNFCLKPLVIASGKTRIFGNVYYDIDGDKTRDVTGTVEPDLIGWQVWLDLDKDGVLDSGEPTQVTDKAGNYLFDNLTAGTSYRVRQVTQGGWSQTTTNPADIVLATNQAAAVAFGLRQTAPLRVNAGGGSYTDTFSDTWYADQGFTGGTKSTTSFAVAGTDDDALFYNYRSGTSFSFDRSLPVGSYKVKLLFTEPTKTASGQRKFDVKAENTLVLDDFDLYSAGAGNKKVVTRTYTVNVGDGVLNLQFTGVVDAAIISGIQVIRDRATYRIDVGSTASYTDTFGDVWSSDSGFFTGGSLRTSSYDVLGTSDDTLYRTDRYGGNFSLAKAVTSGRYLVKLLFADPTSTAAGQRKFNVTAEGSTVLSNFDIYSAAGAAKKKVVRNLIVDVKDGTLNLGFIGVTGNAMINGIEIIPLL